MRVDIKELGKRENRFRSLMDRAYPDWDTVFILSNENQYYFTGTMQNGFLVIKRNGSAVYFVYKSFTRAGDESNFPDIYPISSYRDAAAHIGTACGNTFFETDVVPYGVIGRIAEYFKIDRIDSLDKLLLGQRAVKSEYELDIIRKTGRMHADFMSYILPGLLREGMSEAELHAEIYEKIVKHGSHGKSRFWNFRTQMIAGNACFGESSIYPASMDSPDGGFGMHPAVPFVGSRERKLKKTDLIFVDLAYGNNGYYTDKTCIFAFRGELDDQAKLLHDKCVRCLYETAKKLKPGAVPSQIYKEAINSLDEDVLENFMGYGMDKARFIGHGTGLDVDEAPVLSANNHLPLEKGMVIALEPKTGIKGIGLVGAEETFIVGNGGAECITGNDCGIIQI
jgi:Xaa-Pro dipeptidase